MGEYSAIEWTDASWNPATGCSKVSPGCKNCYAEMLAEKLQARGVGKYRNGFKFTLQPQDLELPLKWKKPHRIFVNSMSDLFHEEMPDEYLDQVFKVMCKGTQHTYQILTKRPERMLEYMQDWQERVGTPPDRIWLGVSVESWAFKQRIEILRNVPCYIRFVSFEPLLDSVMLGMNRSSISQGLNLDGISWAIAGGESGPDHRPMNLNWAREIRDECQKQNVAFFYKQLGGYRPGTGRFLDGREWNEMPEVKVAA